MKSNLITREGYEALKVELNFLWKEKRPMITQKVSEAAAQGDRSENADYHYNKKILREIDWRVRYITKRLDEVKIIDYASQQEGKVFFGAYVRIQNPEGEARQFRIAGVDEINETGHTISVDSPMARALIKKEQGDEVAVKTPEGLAVWEVEAIQYCPF